jgi:hypothetical protein
LDVSSAGDPKATTIHPSPASQNRQLR